MGLYNGLYNGLSFNGINNGLQSSYYNGLVAGFMPNETTKDGNAFISIWDTRNTSAGSSNSRQIRLPLTASGTYNFVVDWGDGSKDIIRTFNAAAVTHTYASAGIYTIKIKGIITSMQFVSGSNDTNKILEIVNWGIFKPFDTGAFASCINLRFNNTKDLIDLSTASSSTLQGMFQNCGMTFIRGINQWDITKVNSLVGIFQTNSNFNDLGVSQWNTINITNITQTFLSCTSFNQDLGNWNVSNVFSMSNTFNGASSFNNGGSPSISGWTTSACISMGSMFSSASAFNQPIGSWDVSKVQTMNFMFNGALVFNNGGSPSISGWTTSACTTMASMFTSASAFNQPIGSWNVSNVANMSSMFQSATAFNNGGSPSISGWTTSACTTMASMFQSATAFNQPIGNWNVSNVANMNNMFQSATAFNNGGSPSISGWTTSGVTNMSGMFQSAINFNQPIGNWNVSNVLNMTQMFAASTSFNQPLSGWNVSKVTSMLGMFVGASAFNQDIGLWNVSACTSFNQFMNGKTPATYSQVFLDSIYSGWTRVLLQSSNNIDFGTVKYSSGNTQSVAGRGLLSRANQSLAISNCVNNGSGLIRVTSAAQTLSTGNKVFISGVLGTTEANGPWIVTVINTTTIDLQGSTFVNAYTSGGALRTGYGWTIVDGGLG